ncbi:MAG: CPBP family intramembrane glutamic endopeptidase [Anaerolineales bacterium]
MTGKTILNFVILLSASLTVFVFANPYYRIFPTNWNQRFYIGLSAFFLLLVIACHYIPAIAEYKEAAYAFLTASLALVILKAGFFNLPGISGSSMKAIGLDKLSQFLHIVPVILVMTLLARKDMGEIFLQTGQLKQGLIFGLISFAVFAVIGYFIATGTSDFVPKLIKAVPWLLLFIFANATMEELWFRGIFLNTFDPLVGNWGAILVTSLAFGLSHINVTYEFPGGGIVFGLVVFLLGVAGAYTMTRYDSAIGPILFHAGYDLLIIVPVINSL